MIQKLTWFLTGASIVGAVLNVQKKRASFAIWMLTNATWAVVDFSMGLPAQGVLFLIYFLLSVWGMATWKTA
jgi:nicotinamide riboside transporter PnuC